MFRADGKNAFQNWIAGLGKFLGAALEKFSKPAGDMLANIHVA